MKILKFFLFSLLITVTACSKDDGESNDPLVVSYDSTKLTATFYEPGSSYAPSVDWNGSQGTFALSEDIEGLSIDNTTGVIRWSKLLPPGTYSFSVIAVNDSEQAVVNMELENPFQGTFNNMLFSDSNVSLLTTFSFKPGGYVDIEVESNEYDNCYSTVSYAMDGNSIIVEFQCQHKSNETPSNFIWIGELEQTNASAAIFGDMVARHEDQVETRWEDYALILMTKFLGS